MNLTTAVFLINPNVRAIMAQYDEGQPSTLFKTVDPTIKVDDFVVVPTATRIGFTVCKVTATDVDVDFDDKTLVQWCTKVDIDTYKSIQAMEVEVIKKIQSAEVRKKREDLKKNLLADGLGVADEIKALPFAQLGDEHKPETPPSSGE